MKYWKNDSFHKKSIWTMLLQYSYTIKPPQKYIALLKICHVCSHRHVAYLTTQDPPDHKVDSKVATPLTKSYIIPIIAGATKIRGVVEPTVRLQYKNLLHALGKLVGSKALQVGTKARTLVRMTMGLRLGTMVLLTRCLGKGHTSMGWGEICELGVWRRVTASLRNYRFDIQNSQGHCMGWVQGLNSLTVGGHGADKRRPTQRIFLLRYLAIMDQLYYCFHSTRIGL